MSLADNLRRLQTWAVVTGPANNESQMPTQQVTFKGKLATPLMVFPYGHYANVSSSETVGEQSLAMLFAMEGNEEDRAAIAYTPQLRPDDLEPNETAIYHPFTKTFIKFRNNGDIDIDSKVEETTGNININCVNANLTASENVNVECVDANVTASTSVNVDSPITNLGVGGPEIARLGDSVEVVVGSGSSAGTWSGTITSSGVNTSI